MNDPRQNSDIANVDTSDYGQVLDRQQEILVSEHSRPHWMQAGTITFITMRLADSIPREVIQRWDNERLKFINQRGIECQDWRVGRQQLSERDRFDFKQHFRRLREDQLDTCHGKCRLRDLKASTIVADSLLYFDNERYLMGDFVVMPNQDQAAKRRVLLPQVGKKVLMIAAVAEHSVVGLFP